MEGSKVSGASKEMEIKLLGVARASLEELLGDYCDFLLDRQIRRLERDFVQEGGLRERMTRARLRQLNGGKRSDTKDT